MSPLYCIISSMRTNTDKATTKISLIRDVDIHEFTLSVDIQATNHTLNLSDLRNCARQWKMGPSMSIKKPSYFDLVSMVGCCQIGWNNDFHNKQFLRNITSKNRPSNMTKATDVNILHADFSTVWCPLILFWVYNLKVVHTGLNNYKLFTSNIITSHHWKYDLACCLQAHWKIIYLDRAWGKVRQKIEKCAMRYAIKKQGIMR